MERRHREREMVITGGCLQYVLSLNRVPSFHARAHLSR